MHIDTDRSDIRPVRAVTCTPAALCRGRTRSMAGVPGMSANMVTLATHGDVGILVGPSGSPG